jgi:hypothetical protein
MTQYIRSPLWDGTWILSGVPLGVLILAASRWVAPHTLVLYGAGVVGTAHLVAPICLAWARADLRQIAVSRLTKFILLPLALLLVPRHAGSRRHGRCCAPAIRQHPAHCRLSQSILRAGSGVFRMERLSLWDAELWRSKHFTALSKG